MLKVGEGELENILSGSGSLVKTGTGELTLSGDNTYSGGTTITGGTLTA
ncbi:autotransporter-associated beta strand repeat-containing protein, partial [Salmonella enterica]